MSKKQSRTRRARRTRAKIHELGIHRLGVHRTPRHIYAQVFDPTGQMVLASASTLDTSFKERNISGGNVAAAKIVGELVAQRAVAAGIEKIAFDRSGFKYHGRIRALADSARDNGLKF